ncbi:hypothetical protein TELCIR_21964, partial [Teladorsagia circumcincta]
ARTEEDAEVLSSSKKKGKKARVKFAEEEAENKAAEMATTSSTEKAKSATVEIETDVQGKKKRKRVRKNNLIKQLEGMKRAKLDVVTPEVGAKTFNDFDIDERLLKTMAGESKGPFALFIAPTKELCVQINDLLLKLLQPLPFLRSLNLADLTSDERSVWEN